jgi:hypothetical protein
MNFRIKEFDWNQSYDNYRYYLIKEFQTLFSFSISATLNKGRHIRPRGQSEF